MNPLVIIIAFLGGISVILYLIYLYTEIGSQRKNGTQLHGERLSFLTKEELDSLRNRLEALSKNGKIL